MTDIYKAPEAELQEKTNSGQYGSIESALAGDFQIKPIETMKQAWAMLNGMKLTFWLALLAYIAIALILDFILSSVLGYNSYGPEYSPMELVGGAISSFILSPLLAGLYMITIKHSVGANIKFDEIFKHFDKIIPIFLTTVLLYIAVALGFVLLIIPGIYLLVAFSFSLFLVVEKNMQPLEALKTSRKAVHHQWFQTAGLILLLGLVCVLGALALLVGLIWAVPLASLALALVYRDVFGVEEKTINS